MSDEVYKDADWLQQKYWKEGLSGREVANEAGVTWPTISRWMNEHEIPRRDRVESNHIDLSSEALQFIEGHLLGDGCITNYEGTSALFTLGNKHRRVTEWVAQKLSEYGFKLSSQGVYESSPGYGDSVFHIRTRSYPKLADLRRK